MSSSPAAPRRSARERKAPNRPGTQQPVPAIDDSDGEDIDSPVDSDSDDGAFRGAAASKKKTFGRKSTGEGAKKNSAGTGRKKAVNGGTGVRKRKSTAKGAGAAGEAAVDEGDEDTLFASVANPNTALSTTVQDWLEAFQESEAPALRDLINFLIRSTGCRAKIDADQAIDLDGVPDVLDDMQEDFKKQTDPIYPIVSRAAALKKFRSQLSTFLSTLLTSASESPALYASSETGLMETLMHWTTTMASSKLRAFRHTATVWGLTLVTALCDVAKEVEREFGVAGRQRDAEAGKSKARARAAEDRLKEVHERLEKVNSFVDELIDGVFIHRFRDSESAIRSECVRELGVWMKSWPQHFLEGTFLRYTGWLLSDQDPHTRLLAIQSLLPLYSSAAFLSQLHNFTERFRPRLIEMASKDRDVSVRVSTIAVLHLIGTHELLEDEDRLRVATLVFDAEARVRKAVGPFWKALVEDEVRERVEQVDDAMATPKAASAKKGGGRKAKAAREEEEEVRERRVRCKTLADLLVKASNLLDTPELDGAGLDSQESEDVAETLAPLAAAPVQGRLALAVAALWDSVHVLRDWEGLLDLLGLDHSKGGDIVEPLRLAEDEESTLLEVFVACLARIREDAVSAAEGGRKTKKQADDDVNPATLHADATRGLIKALPKLFTKHQTDAGRIAEVLTIPKLMQLDMYLEMRQVTAYESLFDDIASQFLKHTSPNVLLSAVDALSALASTQALANSNTTKATELEERLLASMRELVADREIESAGFDEDEVAALEAALARFAILYARRDLSSLLEDEESGKAAKGREIVAALADRGRLGYKLEEKMAENALQVLFLHVVWKTSALLREADGVDEEELEHLKDEVKAVRDSLLETVNELAVGTSSNACEGVRSKAFKLLLELYVLFASGRPEAGAPKSAAHLPVDFEEELQYRCAGFVEAEVERHAEEHARARQEEDSEDEDGGSGDEDEDENDEGGEDEEEGPQKKGKKGKGKAAKGKASGKGKGKDEPLPLTAAQAQAAYVFCDTISAVVKAIRLGVMDIQHAPVLLAHHGRFGPMYDAAVKPLIDVLKEEALFNDNCDLVQNVVASSVKDSFDLFLNGKTASEQHSVLLARALAGALLVRGAHLKVVRRVDPAVVIRIHTDSLDYVAKQLGQLSKDKKKVKIRNKTALFFRALVPLLGNQPVNLIEGKNALKVKSHLDKALKDHGIEVSATSKAWEPVRAYEKRLVSAIAKNKNIGAKSKAKPSAAANDGDAGAHDASPTAAARKRPQQRASAAAAKSAERIDSDDYAAAEELEAEADRPRPKPRAKRAAADEDGPAAGDGRRIRRRYAEDVDSAEERELAPEAEAEAEAEEPEPELSPAPSPSPAKRPAKRGREPEPEEEGEEEDGGTPGVEPDEDAERETTPTPGSVFDRNRQRHEPPPASQASVLSLSDVKPRKKRTRRG